jgi:hypothetical protein
VLILATVVLSITPDATDVKRLTAVCDDLYAFKKQTVHVTEQQLMYLCTLDKAMKQTARDTVEQASVARLNSEFFIEVKSRQSILARYKSSY